MIRKINVFKEFDRIPEAWSPHVAARANDLEIRLARIEGSFDWRCN